VGRRPDRGRTANARSRGGPGRARPYTLQAAIAALHTEESQDWPQIAGLYRELARLTGSPVAELNRAVAIAEAGDVEAALALIEPLELDRYQYLHSTRAELLRRLGRFDEARSEYERALGVVHSDPERRLLERRLGEIQAR
jgi:RNA polymerase sigma-70 factor, ECF subfamily